MTKMYDIGLATSGSSVRYTSKRRLPLWEQRAERLAPERCVVCGHLDHVRHLPSSVASHAPQVLQERSLFDVESSTPPEHNSDVRFLYFRTT